MSKEKRRRTYACVKVTIGFTVNAKLSFGNSGLKKWQAAGGVRAGWNYEIK